MKHGPGYLDVAVSSHLDMLKVREGAALDSPSAVCRVPQWHKGHAAGCTTPVAGCFNLHPWLRGSADSCKRHCPVVDGCEHHYSASSTLVPPLTCIFFSPSSPQAQGSCPRNMSTEEYAAHTLSPAVMHELKEAVGNNKWLEWEHLDQV